MRTSPYDYACMSTDSYYDCIIYPANLKPVSTHLDLPELSFLCHSFLLWSIFYPFLNFIRLNSAKTTCYLSTCGNSLSSYGVFYCFQKALKLKLWKWEYLLWIRDSRAGNRAGTFRWSLSYDQRQRETERQRPSYKSGRVNELLSSGALRPKAGLLRWPKTGTSTHTHTGAVTDIWSCCVMYETKMSAPTWLVDSVCNAVNSWLCSIMKWNHVRHVCQKVSFSTLQLCASMLLLVACSSGFVLNYAALTATALTHTTTINSLTCPLHLLI